MGADIFKVTKKPFAVFKWFDSEKIGSSIRVYVCTYVYVYICVHIHKDTNTYNYT